MKRYSLIFTLLLALAGAGCKKDGNCFQKGGNYTTELRDTSSFFQAIRIQDRIDLVFETGADNRVECIAPAALQDLVSATTDTSTLSVRNQNKCRWLGKYDEMFTLKVRMPNIYNLEILGNNAVRNTDTIRTDYFRVYLESASGTLDLNVQNEHLVFSEYSGICQSRLSGHTQFFEAACSGNTAKHFEELSAVKTSVINAGPSDVYLGKCEVLEVEIRHSGNIYYTGNPVISKYSAASSGKLIKY